MYNPKGIVLGNGKMNFAQMTLVATFVRGLNVISLGSGTFLTEGRMLCDLGCAEVLCIEKEPVIASLQVPLTLRLKQCYFKEVPPQISEAYPIAFVSWPNAYNVAGLTEILEDMEVIIYLGSNTLGSWCGPDEFWDHVTQRHILGHIPDLPNTLTVYGKKLDEPRGFKTVEEQARTNFDCHDQIYHFQENEIWVLPGGQTKEDYLSELSTMVPFDLSHDGNFDILYQT